MREYCGYHADAGGYEYEIKIWFDLAGLLDDSSIPRSRIKKEWNCHSFCNKCFTERK